jgi:hypothetical protein
MATFNRSANPPMILPVSPGDGIVHRRFAGLGTLDRALGHRSAAEALQPLATGT